MGLKILVVSNAPWTHTGYGVQTKGLIEHMLKFGHEIAVLGFHGLTGNAIEWRGIPVYPARRHKFGQDVVGYYAQHFDADIVITLIDLWVIKSDMRQRCGNRPWVAWFPLDGQPAVNSVTIERARAADYPVCFSKFALGWAERMGLECDYIPLGVDCEIFKPGDQMAARARLGLPLDRFMVTMVAANKGYPARKSFGEALEAFSRFRASNTSAMLYLHTNEQPDGGGILFDELFDALGVPSSARAIVPPGEYAVGIPPADLATIYQASDVLLAPSTGEGFGLPIAEAQACGCPVITQRWTAMPELVKNGIVVEPKQRFWVPSLNQWAAIPDIERLYYALNIVMSWTSSEKANKSAAGVSFVRERYAWPVVADAWRGLLERIEAELW